MVSERSACATPEGTSPAPELIVEGFDAAQPTAKRTTPSTILMDSSPFAVQGCLDRLIGDTIHLATSRELPIRSLRIKNRVGAATSAGSCQGFLHSGLYADVNQRLPTPPVLPNDRGSIARTRQDSVRKTESVVA